MPDSVHEPRGIAPGDALRALPQERPAASAWPRLAAGLAPRRPRWRPLLALAAAVALAALLLPRLPQSPPAAPGATSSTGAPADPLPALVQESATLEALLAATADQQVGSGTALLLRARLQQRIQLVDALLEDPDTDSQARLPLWQERVLLLRGLAGLEGGEQVLAANGQAGAATLVVTL
jgi:hypothetical protein